MPNPPGSHALAGLDSRVISTSLAMRQVRAMVSKVRATLEPFIRDGVPPPKKIVSTMGRSAPWRSAVHSSSRTMASIQPASSISLRTWELKSQ